MRRVRRWLQALGALLALLLLAAATWALSLRHPRPTGTPGAAAEALAATALRAVDAAAWARTGAVRWSLGARRHHLWDRRRQLERVRVGDLEVLLDLKDRRGRARRGGAPLAGAALAEALDDAWGWWCNDSFWLNPVAKLLDDGVRRERVTLEGGESALLVSYARGGRTPGDSYLWRLGRGGLPSAWRMWVAILPVGGVEVTWEGWITLATGARISTLHRGLPVALRLVGVAGAATLAELEPGEPFAELVR